MQLYCVFQKSYLIPDNENYAETQKMLILHHGQGFTVEIHGWVLVNLFNKELILFIFRSHPVVRCDLQIFRHCAGRENRKDWAYLKENTKKKRVT